MSQKVERKGFPLPKVAEALAPYIQTRQELLRIRRILTIFLAQNIKGSHLKIPSPRSLAVPSDDFQVKRIPLEFTGVRKRYLHALQAHVRAREAYDLQVQRPDEAALKAMRQDQFSIESDMTDAVVTRLELLHEQRKYQKLKILQDYLNILAKKDAAKPNHLSMDNIMNDVSPATEIHSGVVTESQTNGSAQALILCLRKAVLRAHNALETERSLLAKLKIEDCSTEVAEEKFSETSGRKVFALSRTRDELIDWIEQQLANGTQLEDIENRNQLLHLDKVPLDITQRKQEIRDKYESYLQARRSLVTYISEMNEATFDTSVVKQDNPSPRGDKENDTVHQEATLVLPYLTEQLIPAADDHQAFLRQESHIAYTLKSETRETVKVLDKLADESHLLSNYPSPAAQPRFQNPVAGFNSDNFSHTFNMKSEGEEAQIIRQVRIWASAASAASTARRAAVEERLGHGESYVGIAQDLVKELHEILGKDYGEDEIEVDPQFSLQIAGNPQRKHSNKRGRRDQTGIWSGLDGNISIEENTPGNIP